MRIILFALIAFGCTTTPGKPDFKASEVIERMGGASETPKWAVGENPMQIEGSDVVFISFLTMGADSRPEACFKASELEARSSFLRHIQEGISSSGQLNEQSAADDPAFESLTAFLSQGKVSGAKTTARYWEKVEQSSESGDRVLKLHCSVKVAVKRSELERQIRAALGNGGNKEIRDQLISAQKQFINSIAETGAPAN